MMHPERGSAVLYVFIAIALFAALWYSVARNSRITTSNITDDAASMAASELMDYGSALVATVEKMRLRGIQQTQISFDTSGLTGYVNASCTDAACKVFQDDGGGMSYTPPGKTWLDTAYTGKSQYGDYVIDGKVCVDMLSSGTYANCLADSKDNEELVFIAPYITKEICLKINDRLGITNPAGDAPLDVGCSWTLPFTGTFGDAGAIGDAAGNLKGKSSACYKQDPGCPDVANSYNYYQVLQIR